MKKFGGNNAALSISILISVWRTQQSRHCAIYLVFVRQCPHYVGEIWKRSLLFLRLGLPSKLTVTKTELFENALQTGGIWKRRLFVFVLPGNTAFWKPSFSRRWPNQVFLKKHKRKWSVIVESLQLIPLA